MLMKSLTSCLIVLLCLVLSACGRVDDSKQNLEPENGTEETAKEEISEKDFTLRVDTLPYRGAVLFVDYDGEADLSEYILSVDISQDGELRQNQMPVEVINEQMIAEIIDLMYQPGRNLEIVLHVLALDVMLSSFDYSLLFERFFPWKDWIFCLEEQISLTQHYHNFKYIWPGIGSGLESHASWDFMTRHSDDVYVYSGTEGIVLLVSEYRGEYNVYLYNPYVGAIIQHGHLVADLTLRDGQNIYPGDYIGRIALSNCPHVHYSIIRPLKYTRDPGKAWMTGFINIESKQWDNYYWPIIDKDTKDIFDTLYYQNPFYFHEPTFFGYWYRDTLPENLYEQMLTIFLRDNPEAGEIEAWLRGEESEIGP